MKQKVKLNTPMKVKGVRLKPGAVVPAEDIGNMLELYLKDGHLEYVKGTPRTVAEIPTAEKL